EALAAAGELRRTRAGYVWGGRDYPAARVPLRSTGADAIAVVEARTGSVLGMVERERAHSTVHDGAVYLHLGDSYRVLGLDLDARVALVEAFAGDYYTQAKKETTTAIEETELAGERLGVGLCFGRVSVTEQVTGYQKKSLRATGRRGAASVAALDETLEVVALDLPPTTFETEAVWFVPEPPLLAGLEQMPRLLGSLHAAEHALIALLPLWAMCDRWDIGGLSTNLHFQTGQPTIFVYDGHPGGVGITRRGYEAFAGWVGDTARMLSGCLCERGCPSCVQSPKCGNLNEPLDKAGARTLLDRMLSR
ncbi:MAG: DUF1998 domain-containing protein, partial [Actinomycetota bacterium]|nr:DUF1998 domain-containing protein [Actinomycetota bacterium]